MLKYIFRLIILLPVIALGQQDLKVEKMDTVQAPVSVLPTQQRYGLRVGVDLHRLTRSFYDDGFRAIEVVGDFRLNKKLYAAAELGNVDYTVDDRQLNFTTKGSYLKIGLDVNAYENWLDMENMIYFGFRYGFSTFNHTLNSYTIYQNSDVGNAEGQGNYFEDVTVQSGEKFSGLSAHWVELVGGVKAELFANIYLGFSVRINSLISNKKPKDFDNLYIPGFNRTYDGSFGVGFNYTLSYLIPLYKKKTEVEKQAKKK